MIKTHHAPHCKDSPWMALDMDRARELLEGYGLTDEERSQIPDLMIGYCRLIDEAGLIGYGMTEEGAIQEARLVTVCDKCLQASCWQGLFYCNDYQTAGTREVTVAELRRLDREHESYWSQEGQE